MVEYIDIYDDILMGKYCPLCNSESVQALDGYYTCMDCGYDFDNPIDTPVDVWGTN